MVDPSQPGSFTRRPDLPCHPTVFTEPPTTPNISAALLLGIAKSRGGEMQRTVLPWPVIFLPILDLCTEFLFLTAWDCDDRLQARPTWFASSSMTPALNTMAGPVASNISGVSVQLSPRPQDIPDKEGAKEREKHQINFILSPVIIQAICKSKTTDTYRDRDLEQFPFLVIHY